MFLNKKSANESFCFLTLFHSLSFQPNQCYTFIYNFYKTYCFWMSLDNCVITQRPHILCLPLPRQYAKEVYLHISIKLSFLRYFIIETSIFLASKYFFELNTCLLRFLVILFVACFYAMTTITGRLLACSGVNLQLKYNLL